MGEAAAAGASEADAGTLVDRALLLCILIKCADLANEIRPDHKLSEKWASCVMSEFFNQGDLEKKLGIEVGFLNDRHKTSTAKGQVGFIDFLAMPLYNEACRVIGRGFNAAKANMLKNRELWEKQANEEEEKKKKEEEEEEDEENKGK